MAFHSDFPDVFRSRSPPVPWLRKGNAVVGPYNPDDSSLVLRLDGEHVSEVTRVLCESFRDYPVMRYVLGPSAEDYERRLRKLIRFFVMARVLRDEPLFGIRDGEDLVATALVSYPDPKDRPRGLDELDDLRTDLWADLGSESRSRYTAFGTACSAFELERPHIHLNMIGTCTAAQGRGMGGRLMHHVQLMSMENPSSEGVTLTTESPSNVPFYEHFGYHVVGHTRVSPELETWGFFRPDERTTNR